MNGAAMLCVEVDPARIQRRLETGYCDRMSTDLEQALAGWKTRAGRSAALGGLAGNCAEVLPKLVQMGVVPTS